MGTNYYLRLNICPDCGRYDSIHIGKSSSGWRFLFRGYPDTGDTPLNEITSIIHNVRDWQEVTPRGEIWDEYGTRVPYELFWGMVASKQSFKTNDYHLLIDGYMFSDTEFS